MKTTNPVHILLVIFSVLILSSCGKGYQVRFTNYYTESMDSVIIGNNTIVFTNIDEETSSGYKKLKKGNYNIICVTKTKKRFGSTISIPKSGDGKRTIQIDAINNFSILED